MNTVLGRGVNGTRFTSIRASCARRKGCAWNQPIVYRVQGQPFLLRVAAEGSMTRTTEGEGSGGLGVKEIVYI